MIALGITASQCTGMPGYGCALRVEEDVIPGDEAAKDLAAEIHRLCAKAGVAPADIGEVRLDLGPGSYVGLRVAVTTAAFLRSHGGARVLTATSLELMAAASLQDGARGPLRPVLDGRRHRYHTALLETDGTGSLRMLEPPAAIGADDLLQRIGAEETLLAAEPLHGLLAARVAEQGATLRPPIAVHATTLFLPQVRLREGEPELEPLYLMGSYAE